MSLSEVLRRARERVPDHVQRSGECSVCGFSFIELSEQQCFSHYRKHIEDAIYEEARGDLGIYGNALDKLVEVLWASQNPHEVFDRAIAIALAEAEE